jgi:P pilus assembly chaperone PapD
MWPFGNDNRLIIRKLDTIIQMLDTIRRKEVIIMATMADLVVQVQATAAGEASAIVLIQGLAAKIQELINSGADPVALQAAVDELKASSDALAAAVVATPV